MALPAAEGTTQIAALRIARMGGKEYAAMPATLEAMAQLRLCPQGRPQKGVILSNQTAHLARPVPIGSELEVLLEADR